MAPEPTENQAVGAAEGPDGYIRIEPRADGHSWVVSVRGHNERNVWGNGEGWDLHHSLEQSRKWFPQLTIQVITVEGSAPTVITPDEPAVMPRPLIDVLDENP